MRDLVRLIVWAVVDLFRSRAAIEAEILTLRQQIIVLRRTAAKKQTFGAIDRLVFVGLYRLFPRVLDALAIVRPGTVIKWHRAGFRLYWRWKSRPRGGRPCVQSVGRRVFATKFAYVRASPKARPIISEIRRSPGFFGNAAHLDHIDARRRCDHLRMRNVR